MRKRSGLSVCALVALAGTSAGAQVIDWASPTNGDWNNSANWVGADIPNTISEDAVLGFISAYTVDTFANFTIGGLSITNPLATLNIGSNRTLTLNNNFLNNGLMVINPTGTPFNAHLSFASNAAISGTGTILLNAQTEPNDAQILGNTFTITHPDGHTIHGSGNISGTMTNSGMIVADIPGGVGLRLSGTMTQTPTGVVGADGGTLLLGNGSITTGGELMTLNGGKVEAQNNATIGSLNNTGDLDIPGQGRFLLLNDSIDNNGTITINSNNNIFNAHLQFDVASTITGTGNIVMVSLGDLGDAQILTSGAFDGTIGANQTVEGSGQITGANDGTIINLGTINGNHAAVDPDPAIGLALQGNHNGAGGGIYRSDNGLIELRNGLILDGGTFDSTDDGIIDMTTNGTVILSNITNLGQMGIRGQGGSISLIGSMTNNGTLTINSNDNIFNAHLRFDADTSIDGAGTVRMVSMGDLGDAQLYTNGVFNGTIGTNQLIAGSGMIDGRDGGTIVNHGMISADDPLYALELRGNHFGASIGIYNANDGVLALTGGLVLDWGVFSSAGTGVVDMTTNGTATLSRITNTGTMGIRGQGGVIGLAGPLTNNGTININSNGNIFNAHIRFLADTIIDGTGTIDMFVGGDFGDAQILNDQGFIGTIGNGQTITGSGRIQGEMNMDGTLDPSSTFRRFDIDTLHLSSSSAMIADLGGLLAGEFDRLILGGADTINLDGTLTVNLDPGYVPAFGDSWDIIDGGTINSEFVTENVPNAPIGQVYRVIYESDRIFVVLTCDADYTGDGVLNFFDVSKFLALFSAQDPDADITGDGNFNFFDISAFLQIFSAPCE